MGDNDPLQQRQFVPIDEYLKLYQHTQDLDFKVQYLIDQMTLSEGCFTFNDGDTWWQGGVSDNAHL